MNSGLGFLFSPDSIAVVGASPRPGSVGRAVLENLLSGFKGRIYPVNPKYDTILGLRSYRSVLEVPEAPDLVVVTVRAELVSGIAEDAGRRGARGLVVVSGGFAESGPEGERLERELVGIVRRYGMRLVGPNCIGVYDARSGVDTFFIPRSRMRRPPLGRIAVVSQSGAFLTTFMDYIASEGVGIVRAINIGNKADVDEVDLLDYLSSLADNNVIMMYLEDVKPGRGQDLIRASIRARRRGKMVVLLKGGRTESGSRAASSHTAALAGDYRVFSAIARQAGMIETDGPVDFLDAAKALVYGRLPRGGRVAVLTHAGGPGVIATDLLSSSGLEVPLLPEETRERLREVFPRRVAVSNPVDLTGDATEEDYRRALEILLDDPLTDMIYVIVYIQPPTISGSVEHALVGAERTGRKPLVIVTGGSPEGEQLYDRLRRQGLLAYTRLEGGVSGARALYQASRPLCYEEWTPAPRKECMCGEKLLEHEALVLAEKHGLAVPEYCLARSVEEAGRCASRIGGAMAAKIVSRLVTHKSDIGGVILGVSGPDEAAGAFEKILEAHRRAGLPEDAFEGVLFMKMVSGVEAFVGGKWDTFFGPIVLVGSGGVLVELLSDVSIRAAPINRCEAGRMISETRLSQMLDGYRGLRASRRAVEDAVLSVSRMLVEEEICEVDINPLIVSGERAYAVDVRVLRCS